jgi:hypothetical protein
VHTGSEEWEGWSRRGSGRLNGGLIEVQRRRAVRTITCIAAVAVSIQIRRADNSGWCRCLGRSKRRADKCPVVGPPTARICRSAARTWSHLTVVTHPVSTLANVRSVRTRSVRRARSVRAQVVSSQVGFEPGRFRARSVSSQVGFEPGRSVRARSVRARTVRASQVGANQVGRSVGSSQIGSSQDGSSQVGATSQVG